MCGAIFHGIQAQCWLFVGEEGLGEWEGRKEAPRRPGGGPLKAILFLLRFIGVLPFSQDLGALVLSLPDPTPSPAYWE